LTDRPYTDDDLRAEAARQHATLAEDPDYMGVGEQMEDRFVRYEVVDPEHGDLTPPPGTPRWNELGEHEFDVAQNQIHDLINGAANLSGWAVDIGADGLEPEEHSMTVKSAGRPIARAYFAFALDVSESMRLAREETAAVTISSEPAAHVLFQERLGGWPPSTFAAKLLNLWTSADTANADRLATAFPEYAAAIGLVKSGPSGIEHLRAIADGT
jgi:hypothetical protein